VNNLNDIASVNDFELLLKGQPEWETLRDKTQVFNERKEGVKSRGEHCNDVAEISYNLVIAMGGSELEAKRAYLLGMLHDLGHITYGHAGESVADSMIENYSFTEEQIAQIMEIRKAMFGEEYVAKNNVPRKPGSSKLKNICFEHNENSVLQYITMCDRFGYEIDKDMIIGILAHSTSRYSNLPEGLAQQAVRIADKLAYINYDVEDLFKSFRGKEHEENALKEIYTNPVIKDPYGNELKINLHDGRSLTIYEFLTQVEAKERIDLFTYATVLDAKIVGQNKPAEFSGYQTVLTGCNDIILKMSSARKRSEDESISQEERDRYKKELKELEIELYKRSPILYAAYKIKDRSDEYIRLGKGLGAENQKNRTENAISSVGNKDLYNEYVYKSIAVNLEKFVNKYQGMNKEQFIEAVQSDKVPKEFVTLYIEYLRFKEEQNAVVKSLPGNENGAIYPEIYTIISFIGVHSNTSLTKLATDLGYDKQYEIEVLPKLREIMDDKTCYNKETGLLTKKGLKRRTAIIEEYGAIIRLIYGIDANCITPMASEEIIQLYIENGFEVEGLYEKYSNVKDFREEAAKAEQAYIANTLVMGKSQVIQSEEIEEEKGRKI